MMMMGKGRRTFVFALFFHLGDLILKLGDHVVIQVGGPLLVPPAGSQIGLLPHLLESLLDILNLVDVAFLPFVSESQRCQLFLDLSELLFDISQSLLGCRVGILFLFQCSCLDLELQFASLQVIDLFRLRVELHPHVGASLVDQIDRLVGQEPSRNVSVSQLCCNHQRAIGQRHTMMSFILLLQPSQDTTF